MHMFRFFELNTYIQKFYLIIRFISIETWCFGIFNNFFCKKQKIPEILNKLSLCFESIFKEKTHAIFPWNNPTQIPKVFDGKTCLGTAIFSHWYALSIKRTIKYHSSARKALGFRLKAILIIILSFLTIKKASLAETIWICFVCQKLAYKIVEKEYCIYLSATSLLHHAALR